eukprot:tig00000076_g2315.t1
MGESAKHPGREEEAGTVREHVREMVLLGWPIVATMFLGMFMSLVDMARLFMSLVDMVFVGHVGPEALAALSLSNSWSYTCFILSFGVYAALETTCSQAYGAGSLHLVGYNLQRGLVLGALFCVPIGVLWFFADPMLRLLGEDPKNAALAGEFVRILLPSLYPYVAYFCLQRYLQAQGNVYPAMIVGVIANLFNVLFNQIFINGVGSWPGLGYHGSPLATSLSRALLCALLAGYIVLRGLHRPTWGGWSLREALDGPQLRAMLRLALPASAMQCLESWTFQGCTLMAGWLGTIPLAVHAIVLQIAYACYMLPVGFAGAGSTRVGNLLGAGRPLAARRAGLVCVGVSVGGMAAQSLALLAAARVAGRLFTSDPALVSSVAALVPVLAAFQLFDVPLPELPSSDSSP